mmetsp:Transcript_50538/g.162320  ORF Transcript_50538/g.162320 Transcript_50538/m.162320 type:complete len:329 (-) Transcript_50538:13-999(-)
MSAAYLDGVSMQLVILPDFGYPSDDFITEYQRYVPDVVLLAEHGIGVPIVQEFLRSFKMQPKVRMPSDPSRQIMVALVGQLLVKNAVGADEVELSATAPLRTIQTSTIAQKVIVADQGNMEALCTAHVIKMGLMRLLPEALHVLMKGERLPKATKHMVLVCTNGIFQDHFIASTLVDAQVADVAVVPVVSEAAFRFPSPESIQELRKNGIKTVDDGGPEIDSDAMADIVVAIFTEIAVEVNPQDSEEIIAVRLQALSKILGAKEVKVLSSRVPTGRSPRVSQAASTEVMVDNKESEGGALGGGDTVAAVTGHTDFDDFDDFDDTIQPI